MSGRVMLGDAGISHPPPAHMYILGVGIEEMRLSVDLTGLTIQVWT